MIFVQTYNFITKQTNLVNVKCNFFIKVIKIYLKTIQTVHIK